METNATSTLENARYSISSPTGTLIDIPQSYDPLTDIYAQMNDPVEIRKYYVDNGFIVRRKVIPEELCDRVREAFKREVKNYPGSFYRQASGLAEKHKFTDYHYMLNAVMNVQDLDDKKFGRFKHLGLKILTHRNIRSVLNILMQGEAIVAQTMYFEGNPATWPHQDKDYLDATQPGAMVAAWVAVEDIQPGAGRFYVYPKSHKLDIEKLGKHLNIMLDKDAYIKLVVETINKNNLECFAPALKKGDVLFWHGKTIHGSLSTTQPQFSRSSFTAHYMPVARTLIQMQVREKKLILREVDGMKVNFPKDQNRLSNKLMFLVETTFPKAFKKVKAAAIRMHKGK
ncbi:MAG TPA: phytanoyl-CoA dioxygenase family protein [Chryseosolibacter sp.]|nr:phytanoyl-CoA dioxygenase family protein [Chryseosolibacter sp.]